MSKKQMFGYTVYLEQTNHISEREEAEWGSWSSDNSWDFRGVSKGGEYPDIASSLDIPAGEDCFVVWVQWSSGDSFGHSSGAYAEPIGIFKSIAAAHELADAVENLHNFECGKMQKNGDGYIIDTSDGQHFEDNFCSWRGYFESVDCVAIEHTFVKQGE